jgi:hypothetical protein
MEGTGSSPPKSPGPVKTGSTENEAPEEKRLGEIVELFEKRHPEPLSKAVAEMRQRMVEIGFTPDQVPDILIEAMILAMRRAEAREEEKESTRKVLSDEAASKEADIA